MSGNTLFPAALSPASFLFLTQSASITVSSVQRCSQLFPFLPLKLSRAAFILLPRHAWGHMETPPPYDCFHTFLGFKEYQLRTAYWSRVGNPPWQSNLQLMKECGGVLSVSCPHSHIPSAGWYPPNQNTPLLVPPFLSINIPREADFSVSQILIFFWSKYSWLKCCVSFSCVAKSFSYFLITFHYRLLGFPGGSDGKESTCNVEDLGSIPGLGRSPGGGHGNPLQYSCLESPHGQRSLAGYSPWSHKESDMTEWLSIGYYEILT